MAASAFSLPRLQLPGLPACSCAVHNWWVQSSYGTLNYAITCHHSCFNHLVRLQVYRNCSGSAGSQAAVTPSSSSSSNSEPIVHRGRLQQHCKVAGRQWTFETGRLARLAHGSCQVTVGGTSVLATAVVDPTPQLEADGVPLQVCTCITTAKSAERHNNSRLSAEPKAGHS